MASKDIPLVIDSPGDRASTIIRVLFEDRDILVIDKQPRINHHPRHRWEGGTLLNSVMGYVQSNGGDPTAVGPCTRLDRDTSGAVDKAELGKGLRRLGLPCSIKQMDQWVNSLQLNDEGEINRESFIATLNRANQLTRHIHELCHDGGRALFGIQIIDAASFFFAVDQDKSGDLTLSETN